eukprot:1195839-Prorocentrum_minimum.AAC.3
MVLSAGSRSCPLRARERRGQPGSRLCVAWTAEVSRRSTTLVGGTCRGHRATTVLRRPRLLNITTRYKSTTYVSKAYVGLRQSYADVQTSLAHAFVGCVCRMTPRAHDGGLIIGVFSENNAAQTAHFTSELLSKVGLKVAVSGAITAAGGQRRTHNSAQAMDQLNT